MKFPLSWLSELVDINVTTEELATTLSMAGLEVESVETIGDNITGITTAKIQSINPHPNADRLVVTQVHDGTTTYQIVTGAKNITVGDISQRFKVLSGLSDHTVDNATAITAVALGACVMAQELAMDDAISFVLLKGRFWMDNLTKSNGGRKAPEGRKSFARGCL